MTVPSAKLILEAFIMYLMSINEELPAPVPKIIDCTKVDYCCHYSLSCIDNYKRIGGTNNYSGLVQTYPCCLCSSLNNDTCICAKGGYVIRDLTIKLPQNRPEIQVGAYIVLTQRGKGFTPKAKNCVMNSDCTDAVFCAHKCRRYGTKGVTERYECCSCGRPLGDECENCSCATNTSYIRKELLPSLAAFVVGITEGPALTNPVGIPGG